MSFTITCNKCGSTNVWQVSRRDGVPEYECNACGYNDHKDSTDYPPYNPLGPIFTVKPVTRCTWNESFGQADILRDTNGEYASFDTVDEARAWLEAGTIPIHSVFIMSLVG